MSKKGFIICIDDEQAVLNQLSGQLAKKFGNSHEIEIAESAEEAMELIDQLINQEHEHVELVICDQIMPGLKGDRCLEQLNARFPEIKKILLTGQAGLESAIYAINKANLDKYIEKPWEIEDLSMTIKTLTEQYTLKRRLDLYNKELEKKNKNLETLHQIGITLNAIRDADQLYPAVIAACTKLTVNQDLIYFHQSGIDRKPPLASPQIAAELVSILWQGYSHNLEDALKAGIPLTLDHRQANEYFSTPLSDQFPTLKFTVWIPVSTKEKFLGTICLFFNETISTELTSTLSILANQFATTLYNLELTADKIKGERLATIGQMISSIIHDFKNPMTTIKGMVGLMGDSDFALEERKMYSNMVIEEVDRVVGMVNELLEFSRGGRGEFRKTDVLLGDVLDKICTVYEKEFEGKGITIVKQFDYKEQIQIDVEKMKRALFNIIDNARDAMADGGSITVASARKEDAVELTIADTGPGMPPEIRDSIFEPFVSHGKIHGTGLGMAITKKIIDDHKGHIALVSEPGQGTIFTIRLPLAPTF
ncbi:response regulator [bacterium]|nr:response regulator [bacterium]